MPKKVIRGNHISNKDLYKHYGSADILLNDHWDDMREKGFVSNRLYDGLASGAFIISDRVKGMGVLEKFVQTYKTPEDLDKAIEYYLNHPQKRYKMARNGMKHVRQNDTYKERAKVLSSVLQQLVKKRLDSKSHNEN